MNKLGETGIYTKEHKSKMAQDAKFEGADPGKLREEQEELEEKLENMKGGTAAWKKVKVKIDKLTEQIQKLDNAPAEKASPIKKRVRHEGAEEEEAAAPPKKKRAAKSKVKKAEDEEDEEQPKSAKKSRAKKAVKKEESVESVESEDVNMKLDSEEEEEDSKPVIKKRAKNSVKQEEDESDDDAEIMPAPSRRARVKKEGKIKGEQDDQVKLPAKKASRAKKAVKTEDTGEASKPIVKKGRSNGKKVAKPESSDAEDSDEVAVESKEESSAGDVKGESKSNPNGRLSDIPSYNGDVDGDSPDSSFNAIKDETVKDEASDVDVDVKDDESEEEKKSVKKASGRVKKEKA